MSPTKPAKHARGAGRPPKFAEPRRPITVTLPTRTLNQLERMDADRARAIVGAVEIASGGAAAADIDLVTITPVAPGLAVILVASCDCLRGIPWLHIVPIAPNRNILAVHSGTSIERIELALSDLLESLPATETRDRELVEQLRRAVHASRRLQTVTKAEILFVDTSAELTTATRQPRLGT